MFDFTSRNGSSSVASARRDWLLPLMGTAASLAFAAALTATLRILRGFARSREAAFDPPQAILVLGGDKRRELLAAKFAVLCGDRSISRMVKPATHASSVRLLPVYVSSGHDDVGSVMLSSGVHPSRLRIDNRALDTVTNFTTMLSTFLKAQYTHVYVVTSDYHVVRASMVATLVFCSHGIAFTAVVIPSKQQKQDAAKQRPGGRAGERADELAGKGQPAESPRQNAGSGTKLSARQGRRLADGSSTADSTVRRQGQDGEWKQDGELKQDEGLKPPIPPEHSSATEYRADLSSSLALSAASEAAAGGASGASEVPKASSSTRTGLPKPSSLASFRGEGVPEDSEEDEIEAEGWIRNERDRMRTLLWMLTGWHGAELLRFTRPQRYRLHKQKPVHPQTGTKQE